MKRILVVDDSSIARDIVSRVLGKYYELIMAESGKIALEKVTTECPDLILLDLLMQDMDGFAILERLRESGNTIPVLVLSADIQKSTKSRVLSLGAADLVNKPIIPATLREAVEKFLQPKE